MGILKFQLLHNNLKEQFSESRPTSDLAGWDKEFFYHQLPRMSEEYITGIVLSST